MKFVVICLLLVQGAFGQMQQSDAQAYGSTITATDLKDRLYVIASDSMEGRETATPGLKKAAAYIENQFRLDGLLPAWHNEYQQKFPVYRDSTEKVALAINNVALKRDTDFAVSYNSGFNITLQSGGVLFAGYGVSDSTRDDYADADARGKIENHAIDFAAGLSPDDRRVLARGLSERPRGPQPPMDRPR